MTATLCPYCGHDLKVLPSRRKKCPACARTIYFKKPFPYTEADAHVSKALMTEEQYAQRESDWAHRPEEIPQIRADGTFPDGRRPGETYYDRDLRGWRESTTEIPAIEVLASPRQPCDHQVRRLWALRDPPPMPPPDCQYEHCLCHASPVFADEVGQREIFGWHVFDADGRFTPLPYKSPPEPLAQNEVWLKSPVRKILFVLKKAISIRMFVRKN